MIRAQAHLTAEAGALIKIAHGNMDGVTVFHCPFCGSGQVVNSGTSIECGFCHCRFHGARAAPVPDDASDGRRSAVHTGSDSLALHPVAVLHPLRQPVAMAARR